MYVPETHPLLGYEFNEREDEGHVFKVIFILGACYCYLLFAEPLVENWAEYT